MPLETETVMRQLAPADLDDINAVIEAAVMSWDKAERVRRLALVSCQYGTQDFDHLTFFAATRKAGGVVGVVSWEVADTASLPEPLRALSIHGLYVHPGMHGRGVGTRLFEQAVAVARRDGFDGLLVRAMRDAQGFFARQGMRALPVVDPARDYPHRFWLDLGDEGQR